MLTPYPFQTEAVDKLEKEDNVLIGDDMGLGKTVEAILLDQRRRVNSNWPARTLIVTPTNVMTSWENHFKAWAPQLRVMKLDRKDRLPFEKAVEHGSHDVYIMHWEALRLMPQSFFTNIKWLHVIADEVHRAKNRKAQQTIKLKQLKTRYKTGLSGTAADNKPDDLWSPLNWLKPKIFSSYHRFYNYHIMSKTHNSGGLDYTPCEACLQDGKVTVHRNAYKEITGVHDVELLRNTMLPFFVRRLKEEVLTDLPEKYYSEVEVELGPQQRRAYNQMRDHMLTWIGEHEDEILAAPVVISQLMRLQQFAVAYGELVMGKKVIVDSETGRRTTIDAEVLKLTEPSAKIDAAIEILEDNPGKQLAFWSQSKQAINLLARRLEAKGITVGVFTGDTGPQDRDRIVEEFQAGKLQIFAGTIQAGGEGITLTAADTAVFLDRAWSPSKNRQVEDRHHRIGQPNAVHIIDLVAKDTIDLGRLLKIELKWSWIKELLGDPKEIKKKIKA